MEHLNHLEVEQQLQQQQHFLMEERAIDEQVCHALLAQVAQKAHFAEICEAAAYRLYIVLDDLYFFLTVFSYTKVISQFSICRAPARAPIMSWDDCNCAIAQYVE